MKHQATVERVEPGIDPVDDTTEQTDIVVNDPAFQSAAAVGMDNQRKDLKSEYVPHRLHRKVVTAFDYAHHIGAFAGDRLGQCRRRPKENWPTVA